MSKKQAVGRALEDFEPLMLGEMQLLDACSRGIPARLSDDTPELATNEKRVRAAFLRFLLLGGDEQAPLHERGVSLQGAFVEGLLDLIGCSIETSISFVRCRFDTRIHAEDARMGGLLNLTGSYLDHGLSADRLSCAGGVFLRNDFQTTGEIRLVGAQIGGVLDCNAGLFRVKEGDALSADGANLKGGVLLNNGFRASGPVRLPGAKIGGDLDCSSAQLNGQDGDALWADGIDIQGDVILSNEFRASGEVRLLGAQIHGDLNCEKGQFEVKNGDCLSADRADINGSVFLRNGFKAVGTIRLLGVQIAGNLDCSRGNFQSQSGAALSLDSAVVRGAWFLHSIPKAFCINASHAYVTVLVDDWEAWEFGSILDGFRYGSLGGQARTSGVDRLKWLRRQPDDHLGTANGGAAFRPYPWRQLQRVLREMGHNEDAKQVGIAFEAHTHAIGRLGQSPQGTHKVTAWVKRVVAQSAHRTFGELAGYGYRPIRLVAWMVAVWCICGMAYWWMALPPRSAMAPTDALVFQNPAYAECMPDRAVKPGNWYLCAPLRGEYATFSPFAFSLDVMLPVVDLGQEKTWGAFVPTPKESPVEELLGHWHWGHVVRLLTWFEILFGWLSSLLLVAIVSGFSRRNDES